ncbi:hypothetical protein ACTFIV_008296 [Dictyostelium citrinum]
MVVICIELTIEFWDYDTIGDNDFIGSFKTTTEEILRGQSTIIIMKYILLFLFLFNIFLIVSSQYDVFNLHGSNCENTTLLFNECGIFCNKRAKIQKDDIQYYSNDRKTISFYTDYYCKDLGYYKNTNTPYIIKFTCSGGYDNLGSDGRVSCSTLNPQFNSFKFVKGPCVDDKNVTIGVCSSVCGTNIKINYDPFQKYTITTYSSNGCTGIGSTESYGSIDCENNLFSQAKNNQYLSCSELLPISSTSSKLSSIYNIILLRFKDKTSNNLGETTISTTSKFSLKSIIEIVAPICEIYAVGLIGGCTQNSTLSTNNKSQIILKIMVQKQTNSNNSCEKEIIATIQNYNDTTKPQPSMMW